VLGAHELDGAWNADGGFVFADETAETWNNHVETEGNLGRSDLFMSFGTSRRLAQGALFFDIQIPIWSQTTGEQVDIPAVFSFGWNL
jgi:hypothetical protein